PAGDPDRCSTCLYATATDGWNNRDNVYAGRICNIRAPADVVNSSKWEFVTGVDLAGNATWGAYASAVPIYRDPGKVGMTGWTYLPDSGKYLSVQFYYPDPAVSSNTKWHFVECDHPWGPCAANLLDVQSPIPGSYGVSVNSAWSDFTSGTLVVTCSGDYTTHNAAPNATVYTLYTQSIRLPDATARPTRPIRADAR
ncbi:MAG TPA: hypothetical protein VGF59_00005, partial [Bryobacteraceae bacterium]